MSYCSSQPFGKKARSGKMSCTNAMSRLSTPSRCRLSSIDRRTPSIGSSLNAGFISGSPRFNYGKGNFKIPVEVIEKRAKLKAAADRHGVDLRTAALQFSAAADVAVALLVGARSDRQILEDWNSLQAKIPADLWSELREQRLIEPGAAVPASAGG
jgi:D-threo-aldose 1-dehydrogenase